MLSSSPSPSFDPGFSTSSVSWIIWQLADSAFPTGGFAHSGGLEAAWQHGEVRNSPGLESFVMASLRQVSRASLPFVTACHFEPGRLAEFDRLCDVFTTNHVANRASRLQGRALARAITSAFRVATPQAPCCHLAPVFGALTRQLELDGGSSARLFLFTHVRSMLAAGVRLNIAGPLEAQAIQYRLASCSEEVALHSSGVGLDDLAQTSPLLDLWQAAHHRIYSRLFQS